jgi:tripartite-type tricarboxylate transporter receptor subunit TctC
MDRRTFLTTAMAFAASFGNPKAVLAQANSSRPIRAIIPSGPGSAIDPYARLTSDQMAKALGRAVIVEHKPGAGGTVAAQFVAEAPADGHTILIGTQSLMEISPSAYADLRWSLNDFIPLIRGVTAPLVLVSHPSVPAQNLTELVAWIKGHSGKLSYASYSPATPSHFLGFQLNERFGLDLAHVPYRSSGAQATDLMAGHALFGFAQVQTTLPFIIDGKLNAIAVTSAARSRFVPNVPSFAELGYPEFTASVWFGLLLRAGTPAAVAENILSAAKAAHGAPEVKAKLEAQGFDVSGQSGAEFAADIRTNAVRWARLIKASGFKADSGQ